MGIHLCCLDGKSIASSTFPLKHKKTLKRVLFCCFWLRLRAPIVFADNSVSVDFSLNIYYWLLFLGPWGTQHYMTCRHDSQESYTFPGHHQRCLYLLIYSLLRYYVPGTSSILSDVSLGSLPSPLVLSNKNSSIKYISYATDSSTWNWKKTAWIRNAFGSENSQNSHRPCSSTSKILVTMIFQTSIYHRKLQSSSTRTSCG